MIMVSLAVSLLKMLARKLEVSVLIKVLNPELKVLNNTTNKHLETTTTTQLLLLILNTM